MAHEPAALKPGRHLLGICHIVSLALLSCPSAEAQSILPAAPVRPDGPSDILGRTTPRGTVLGFLAAARKGDNELAARYLNTPLRGKAAANVAQQLFVVLDRRLPARLNRLSDRTEGSAEDSAEPDQEFVGHVDSSSGGADILLERVNRGKAGTLWVFSRKTLTLIPSLYAEVNNFQIERVIPQVLISTRIAISLFDWLMLLVGVPLFYGALVLLGRVPVRLAGLLLRRLRKKDTPKLKALPGPVLVFTLAWVIRYLLAQVTLPLLSRQFWSGIVTLMTIMGFVWLAILLIGYGEGYARGRLGSRNLTGAVSFLRFARWAADLVVILVGFFVVLRYLGANPTAAFAGLGVSGIAIALAAQKTLENVLGGLSLILDQTVRVGDFLKVGETTGTVKEIGLRSTGIYTMDRTVVSVPNGQISNLSLENFSHRDKFWFHHVVGLDRKTTASQVRSISLDVDDLLNKHPRAEPGSPRVRFIRLGASSLDVEIVAYFFASDWVEFLTFQAELLLQIMEIIESAGTHLALPTQTVHLVRSEKPNGRSD